MYNKFINVLGLMILALVTLAISQECSPNSNDVPCFNGKYAYRRRYNRNKSRLVPRQSGLAPYVTQCTVSNSFAMTFDDGPFDFTNEVLDQLDNTPLGPVTTTFFINGQNYGCIYDYADTLTRAYQSGHQIALHSWSHPDMNSLSEKDIRFQITHLEDAVRKILGVVPAYFRLPYGYGSDNPTLMGILDEYGYTVIGWDTDSGDSIGYSLKRSKAVYDSIMDPPNPHIVLQHDARQETVEKLVPYAIQVVQNAGYNIMPVASCLGADQSTWYKEMGSPSLKDETWVC